MMKGFDIRIKGRTRAEKDNIMAELIWMLHKAESGEEKRLKKLDKWLESHKDKVSFKMNDGRELSSGEFYDVFSAFAKKGITDSEMVIAEVGKNVRK